MPKFYGAIGFADQLETAPGVWTEKIVEHSYYYEVTRNARRLQSSSMTTNDDITISNQISILADPYAYHNFHNIRYAVFMGTKWKVTNVEVQAPRLIMELGGVYNGQ